MQKNIALNDGLVIPRLGLGVWEASDDEAQVSVGQAIESGYRLIDTASFYKNEAGVGRAVNQSGLARGDITVTTKLWNTDQANPREALEKSLELLQFDYIDLYLIHWPLPKQDLYVKAWEALIKAKEEGLVKSIAVSNFLPEHIQRLTQETGVTPSLNQIEVHPFFNQRDLVNWCLAQNVQVQAWRPLVKGGKGLFDQEGVIAMAKKYNKSPAQVILRWHLQNNVLVIPKSVTLSRIQENIDVFDFTLNDAEMALIDTFNINKRLGGDPAVFEG